MYKYIYIYIYIHIYIYIYLCVCVYTHPHFHFHRLKTLLCKTGGVRQTWHVSHEWDNISWLLFFLVIADSPADRSFGSINQDFRFLVFFCRSPSRANCLVIKTTACKTLPGACTYHVRHIVGFIYEGGVPGRACMSFLPVSWLPCASYFPVSFLPAAFLPVSFWPL